MQDFARIARKTTFVLFLAQSLASAGFIAAATLSSIIGANLGGGTGWSGVPSAVNLLGGAFAASAWGYIMERFGRRKGIAAGIALGALGTVLAVAAINISSLPGFLVGMLLMGVANSAVVLGRFAAAEVSLPDQRGKALSSVVLGGTFGSIFGPLLVGPAGEWVKSFRFNELSGAYAVSGILFVLAMIVILVFLRPDPRDVGRELARLYPQPNETGIARPILTILKQPPAFTALMAMVLGQVVMVGVMVITSLHMKMHQHMLVDISTVISAHTFGMYAFSIVSGWLADKWGRYQIILLGAVGLVLACVTAPLSPDVLPLSISLFLLGLGWNFCFVGGSTLLADQLSAAERARTQGTNDLLVGLASAAASLSAGLVYTRLGFSLVATAGAVLSILPIVLAGRMLWSRASASNLPV